MSSGENLPAEDNPPGVDNVEAPIDIIQESIENPADGQLAPPAPEAEGPAAPENPPPAAPPDIPVDHPAPGPFSSISISGVSGHSLLGLLHRIRRPIADYQFERGIPRQEVFSFVSLLTALLQHSWAAIVMILNTLYQLLPIADGGLFLLRFVLDRLIDIYSTRDKRERTTKAVCFGGQLVLVLLLLYLIWTLILMPIVSLAFYVGERAWNLAFHKKNQQPPPPPPVPTCPKKPPTCCA